MHLQQIEASPEARSASRLFLELVVEPGLPQKPCATKARDFHAALDSIVADVEALEPPREVASLQQRFVDAAQDAVDAVDRAARDADTGTLRCGPAMNKRIYGMESTQRADDVVQELREKGYRLGINGE
jgi:hypothetical protein